MTARKSIQAATYLTLLAGALGGCTAIAPTADVWKPAPVGTSWTTQQRNTGSYGKDMQATITRIADIPWKDSPAVALKTGSGVLLQQPADGRWLALLAPDGRPAVTFDPPAGWSQPIGVGNSWKRPQKTTNMITGKSTEHEWSCTVPAYEKITVPAGTFDAMRVECSSTMDAQDTYWVATTVHPFLKTKSVRGSKHPSGPGTQETELLKLPS